MFNELLNKSLMVKAEGVGLALLVGAVGLISYKLGVAKTVAVTQGELFKFYSNIISDISKERSKKHEFKHSNEASN